MPRKGARSPVLKDASKAGPDIVVKLDEPRDGLGMCGAILIENINGEFRIQKIEQYYPSHRELDQAFGWGLRWVAGSK